MNDTAEIVVLVIATGLIIAGLTVVLWRDLASPNDDVGSVRRVVEALLPTIGAVVLLGTVWAWVT